MDSPHPWLDWLYVLAVVAVGVGVMVAAVKLLLHWARKDDSKVPPDSPRNGNKQ